MAVFSSFAIAAMLFCFCKMNTAAPAPMQSNSDFPLRNINVRASNKGKSISTSSSSFDGVHSMTSRVGPIPSNWGAWNEAAIPASARYPHTAFDGAAVEEGYEPHDDTFSNFEFQSEFDESQSFHDDPQLTYGSAQPFHDPGKDGRLPYPQYSPRNYPHVASSDQEIMAHQDRYNMQHLDPRYFPSAGQGHSVDHAPLQNAYPQSPALFAYQRPVAGVPPYYPSEGHVDEGRERSSPAGHLFDPRRGGPTSHTKHSTHGAYYSPDQWAQAGAETRTRTQGSGVFIPVNGGYSPHSRIVFPAVVSQRNLKRQARRQE
jgi:hypothetical protein